MDWLYVVAGIMGVGGGMYFAVQEHRQARKHSKWTADVMRIADTDMDTVARTANEARRYASSAEVKAIEADEKAETIASRARAHGWDV